MQILRLAWSIDALPTRGVSRPQLAFLVVAALAASLVVVSPPLPPVPAASGAGAEERAVEGYGNLPISFEPNVGQAPNRYDFVARGQGFGMAISATGASLALGTKEAQDIVRLDLLGADRSAHPRALESLPGVVNYFIGNDPAKWRSGVSTFGRVAYRSVLPGIDVTYYGTNAGTLEYDFVVAPNADPKDIRVKFSGASDVALRDGSLVITTASGAVTQEAPVLYQSIAGRRVPVDGRFSLAGDEVGFAVGAYDHHHPLVIDPTLIYSTYLGGLKDDIGHSIAVDGHGAAYVTGSTTSTTFPTPPSPGSTAHAGQTDAFVTKLDPSGQTLIFSTYLGGSKVDIGYGIAVDETGAAYVTGSTSSTDFPVEAPFQGSNAGGAGGGDDAFVTKLDAAGSALTYSTYLGGSGGDSAHGIAVDETGAAYVTGSTSSTDFPMQAPFQGSNSGATDAFVTKLNDKASALIYSTYLGGKLGDSGYGIAVDGEHAAYVTGSTSSEDFPMEVPFQGSNAGSDDAFITMLRPTGSALIYSTYLGGSNSDIGYGIAVDGEHAAYVTGATSSTNFPTTPAPFQGSNAGTTDVFVTKLNATGSAPIYSTYLGGSNSDSGYGIALGGGEAYVTGATSSTNFPMQAPSQASNAGSFDAFVTRLNVTGSTPISSTYLGGSSRDLAQGIAVDGSGAYVAGYTLSTNFPTLVPFQGSNAGQTDAFVTKLTDPTCGGQTVTIQVTTAGTTTSGTAGDDVINGTAGIDTINGLGGNDTICGLAGNDTLIGTTGNDTLYGGDGKDIFYAGDGDDTLYGNDGNDILMGWHGNNTLYGNAGNDFLEGNTGDDYLYGGDGNDTFQAFEGDDHLYGDAGDDNLHAGNGTDTLHGGNGTDTLHGSNGNDTLHGNDGNDTLSGDNGDDTIYGDDGIDTLNAGLGIGGQTPPDMLYGGNGNDTLNGGAFGDKLDGGTGNDKLYGNGAWDKLYGGPGKDTLYGSDGNDHLYGDADNDTLYGGDDNDTLNGGNGGANNDYCNGGGPPTGDTGTLCEFSTNIP